MIKSINLDKLAASPRNVRRAADPQADLELRADIETRGLLQNLVVTPVPKSRGQFAVEAGERRRRALLSLAEDGKLGRHAPIDCLVLDDPALAQEASLAENFQRLSMNPADECLAFRQLLDQGSTVEAIARRFGLTQRFVEGRIRLADLASVVFDALGAGEIGLDVAKAYAATSDRERQAYVFEQVGRSYAANHPDSIRRMMTQATASAGDRRALLVGEEAYVAAGGRIERDLFDDGGSARWLDIAVLERLACEKMDRLAAELAVETGLAFVRPTLDSWVGHAQTEGLRRVAAAPIPLSEDETAMAEALEAELDTLADQLEDEEINAAARAEAEAKISFLSAELAAIVDRPPVVDEERRGQLGAFLLLDPHGRPKLDTTFYSALPEDDAGADGEEVVAPASSGSSGRAGLSQRLIDELAMQRRDILAVHVAADPMLALDLAIFLMADRGVRHPHEKTGSSLIASPPSDPVLDFQTPEAAAKRAEVDLDAALDRSWAEAATLAERFDAFRSLGEEARAAWLGHAVARTLQASLHVPGDRACAFHDHLGQLLGIEVADWWRPTGANYFDRVPKSVTLEALADVGGPALAARYAKSKKTELAQSCERIFCGQFIAELEVKEAALTWVPPAMRFLAPVQTVANDAIEPVAKREVCGGELAAAALQQADEADGPDARAA